MTTITAARPSASHGATFWSRMLKLCVRLLPYMSLPGYYPGSHAYHFRAREQAASPAPAPQKKIIRLPATPFHR